MLNVVPKQKKVQQIECESSTESLVSSDDDFYIGLITVNQAENNESDSDDLHSLIDSDDEFDDENDDFEDQPDVDFVDSTSDVSPILCKIIILLLMRVRVTQLTLTLMLSLLMTCMI